MITFKVISSQFDIEELKTRTHHKNYTVHQCKQSERIGYVSEAVQTFDKQGTLIKSSQEIKSFYFGFPNSAQADKFADFAKYKFPLLDKYHGHCEARLSKRLKSPFEVKIRNLALISDDLFAFFGKCIDQELSPKVIEIDRDLEMRKKVSRL
ncbi:MAG: hypothetical protein IM535_08395 [Pseudanabaena sp. M38BS1SP1A06MG]|nr:hypothetical protein [Pseudanabaena sp. M53BS1SP1A06MG]MCA6592124.1 hypothetical protein [Pseudanabaena sp. M38BS1SP1A06MG]